MRRNRSFALSVRLLIQHGLTLDARGLLARHRRGASERVMLVGEFFSRRFATLLRRLAAQCSVAPNEKKTSGTQGSTVLLMTIKRKRPRQCIINDEYREWIN